MNSSQVTTQAELFQIIIGIVEAIGTHLSIYLTIVSAYLVVAYLVGKNLTRLQVSVATFIFVVAYTFEALFLTVLVRSVVNATRAYSERFLVHSEANVFLVYGAQVLALVILIVIFISSIWFMWSVRHAKR